MPHDIDKVNQACKEALNDDGAILDVMQDQWCDVDKMIVSIRELLLAFEAGKDLNESATGLAEVIDSGVEKYAKFYTPEPMAEGME